MWHYIYGYRAHEAVSKLLICGAMGDSKNCAQDKGLRFHSILEDLVLEDG